MNFRATIHAEINDGSYTCLVCHSEIGPQSPIWTCRSCYRCFDIACIRDWSKQDAARSPKWRCPHCLGPQTQKPSSIRYRCWCGKVANPRKSHASKAVTEDPWERSLGYSNGAIPPHSCGQTCSAKRACPHPCPLVCHAGPHLDSKECMYQGPPVQCFCGKKTEQRVCSDSRYQGFSCGSSCNRTHLKCGHACTRKCHKLGKAHHGNDACGQCRVKIKVTCFCGRMKPARRACNTLSSKTRKNIKSHWSDKTQGQISCEKPCSALLDCGYHHCSLPCHSEADASHACTLVPFEGETCFCGKVGAQRQKCTDPKLSCDNVCGKKLPCGHHCPKRCHDGPCTPCEVTVENVRCRCKRSTQTTTCDIATHTEPECMTRCGALLSCRRHECTRVCCEFAPKKAGPHASTHQRRGLTLSLGELLLNGDDAFAQQTALPPITEAEEAAHLCLSICVKPLGCGMHTCVQPCHAGPCPPCLAASFEEWVCPCGRTRVEPPIRCGAVMPTCRLSCHRRQSCGHDTQHECHPDSIPCPPCAVMVSKPCRCGKSRVVSRCSQNQGSQSGELQCVQPCGRTLECGHTCNKRCCKGGDACLPCESQCGKAHRACGHSHLAPCHFPEECPEQCKYPLKAYCPCGVLQFPYECGEDAEIGCNDVCLDEAYPLPVLDAYEEDKAWCTSIETQLRGFVLQPSQPRTHWFKPMNRKRRRFVHYLLEHYRMEGQSMDQGANRSVCAYRTAQTWLPKTRLSKATRKRPQLDIALDESSVESLDEKLEHHEKSGVLPDEELDGADSVPSEQETSGYVPITEEGWQSIPSANERDRSSLGGESDSTYQRINSRSFSVLAME